MAESVAEAIQAEDTEEASIEEALEVVDYPVWRLARGKILERIESDGHGIIISHEELRDWMGVPEPKNEVTYQAIMKIQFDYMYGIDKLKDSLLLDHCVCIENVRGVGYQVLVPIDQVKIGPTKYEKKIRKYLKIIQGILDNIKQDQLDQETEILRLNGLQRIGFLRKAVKKKYPYIEKNSTPQIEDNGQQQVATQ